MNDRLTPAEEVWAELQDVERQLERARQTIATLGAAYDHVREQLCPQCEAGACSAHQPAAGIINAILNSSTIPPGTETTTRAPSSPGPKRAPTTIGPSTTDAGSGMG